MLGQGGMGEVWRATIRCSTARWHSRCCRKTSRTMPSATAASSARPRPGLPQPPQHRDPLRLEHLDGQHVLVMELVEGEGLDELIARGPIPVDEACRWPCRSPRRSRQPTSGHRAPRSQARQHPCAARRHGQGARLRSGQVLGDRRGGRELVFVADNDPARDRGRGDPRNRRLHVAGAGARQAGRQPRRHLGLRRGAVGDADRGQALRWGNGVRRAWRRCSPESRTGVPWRAWSEASA